jgi:hypothetical protein
MGNHEQEGFPAGRYVTGRPGPAAPLASSQEVGHGWRFGWRARHLFLIIAQLHLEGVDNCRARSQLLFGHRSFQAIGVDKFLELAPIAFSQGGSVCLRNLACRVTASLFACQLELFIIEQAKSFRKLACRALTIRM